MNQHIIVAFISIFAISTPLAAQETRAVYEVEIDAKVDVIWNAFTTTQGLQSWVAPLADVDFRVGGKWRANYNKEGKLGDKNTIENTILCYDPKRMISLKATGFPEGFAFKDAAQDAWSIFYFMPVSDHKTKITIIGLGYTDSEQSQKMLELFEIANKYSMDQLSAAMKELQTAKEK